MSVCISKGNEFTEDLKDTVAVELQGFVRLLTYDLISPNVPSFQPYLVIQHSNFLCLFWKGHFSSPSALITCLASDFHKTCFLCLFCGFDKANQWIWLSWRRRSEVRGFLHYLDDWKVTLVYIIVYVFFSLFSFL